MDVQNDTLQSAPAVQEPPQSPKPNKKAMLIGGVIAAVIFVAGISLLMMKHAASKAPVAQEQSQPKNTSVASAVSHNWYTIKTQYYAVSVPVGWKPKGEPMQGGVSMIIRPVNTEEDPLLVVEAYTTPTSIQKKVNLFRAMGLKQEVATVPNSQPVLLSGTWPTRTIDGKTFKMPTQERVVYIPHGDSLYGVKLYYSSPKPEKVYDDMLQKVLASFVSAS